MILKIVVIAIICVFTSACTKSYSSEFANFISVAGGVLIFLLCLEEIESIVAYISELYSLTNLNLEFLQTLLKIVGVGYIAEFTAEIAEDFGNKSVASKVILGGKIVICGMAIPVIKNLLDVLFSLLS